MQNITIKEPKKQFRLTKLGVASAIILLILGLGIATYFALLSQTAKTPEQGKKDPIVIEAPEKKVRYRLETSVLVLGDVMTARTIGDNILNGEDPFMYVQSELDKHNFVIANIETNISDPAVGTPLPTKLYTFNAPLQSINTIKKAGIDVAVLANNHTSDYGTAALIDMIDRFDKAGLKTVGAGRNSAEAFKPLILEIPLEPIYEDGSSLTDSEIAKLANAPTLKIAIIALNDVETWFNNAGPDRAGSAYFDLELYKAEVNKARNEFQADYVLVIPHWGFEYKTYTDVKQVEWAHLFIDNGADIVIGGHPHVVQPTEEYNGKMIYYSLGNFVFDNMEGAEDGQMLSLKFSAKQEVGEKEVITSIIEQKLINTRLDEKGYPRLVE